MIRETSVATNQRLLVSLKLLSSARLAALTLLTVTMVVAVPPEIGCAAPATETAAPAAGAGQEAVPTGKILAVSKTMTGAYIAQFEKGKTVAVRDVFQVLRGSKPLGDAMVMEVLSANQAVVVPKFAGPLQKGDELVWARHAGMPVESEPKAGAADLGATLRELTRAAKKPQDVRVLQQFKSLFRSFAQMNAAVSAGVNYRTYLAHLQELKSSVAQFDAMTRASGSSVTEPLNGIADMVFSIYEDAGSLWGEKFSSDAINAAAIRVSNSQVLQMCLQKYGNDFENRCRRLGAYNGTMFAIDGGVLTLFDIAGEYVQKVQQALEG